MSRLQVVGVVLLCILMAGGAGFINVMMIKASFDNKVVTTMTEPWYEKTDKLVGYIETTVYGDGRINRVYTSTP